MSGASRSSAGEGIASEDLKSREFALIHSRKDVHKVVDLGYKLWGVLSIDTYYQLT